MVQTMSIAFVSILLGAVGQLVLKLGVTRMQQATVFPALSVTGILTIFTQPYILGGLVLFGSSMLLWLYVLSQMNLSRAYPLVSISYVLVAVLSRVFLNERISPVRALGIAVILVGVALVNFAN